MTRVLPIIVLAGVFAGPATAGNHKMDYDPSCADYLEMSETDRVKAMQKLAGSMPKDLQVVDREPTDTGSDDMETMDDESGDAVGAGSGTMSLNQRIADANKGCESNQDGTVIEALKKMSKS